MLHCILCHGIVLLIAGHFYSLTSLSRAGQTRSCRVTWSRSCLCIHHDVSISRAVKTSLAKYVSDPDSKSTAWHGSIWDEFFFLLLFSRVFQFVFDVSAVGTGPLPMFMDTLDIHYSTEPRSSEKLLCCKSLLLPAYFSPVFLVVSCCTEFRQALERLHAISTMRWFPRLLLHTVTLIHVTSCGPSRTIVYWSKLSWARIRSNPNTRKADSQSSLMRRDMQTTDGGPWQV